jgi:hypothetical protein
LKKKKEDGEIYLSILRERRNRDFRREKGKWNTLSIQVGRIQKKKKKKIEKEMTTLKKF